MANPLEVLTITQGFDQNPGTYPGWLNEAGVKRTTHLGVDYRARTPLPVYAIAHGVIIEAMTNGAWGLNVRVQHDDGFISIYAHLSSRKVEVGDLIEAGELLGLTGNTGRSTAPHLHVSIYKMINGGKRYYDPLPYIELKNKEQMRMREDIINLQNSISLMSKKIEDLEFKLRGIGQIPMVKYGDAAYTEVAPGEYMRIREQRQGSFIFDKFYPAKRIDEEPKKVTKSY